ncbi:MAG: competence/damage-inducible protein A [Christensenellales bacterium]|nr:competence/damage-inducible protein A [Christensenellales bacterium]
MVAEIVAIGTELLMGQIVNADAQYLSRRLQSLGISVYHHTTVGDNPQRLRDALALALSRSDIVITTGGLGSTQDDLSKETVAALLGREMVFDAESWCTIEGYFARMNRACPENNRRQAMFAEGAVILPNACGTAPGCMIEQDGKLVIQLPGPPREMAAMFEAQVYAFLAQRTGGCIASRYLRIYGLGESQVAQMCAAYIEAQDGVTVAPYCSLGECQLRVTARGADEAQALAHVMPVVEALRGILGDAVYAVTDSPEGSMEEAAGRALTQRGLTVATAESCTGGLVAAKLVNYPGISAALNEAHVTYANAAKVRYCGVRQETLDAFGAVSEQTAHEMAQGLRERSGADIAVSTTGVAGPGGGTLEKPVGLVYVGCADAHGVRVERLMLSGDRQKVRELAALRALDMVRRAALGYDEV